MKTQVIKKLFEGHPDSDVVLTIGFKGETGFVTIQLECGDGYLTAMKTVIELEESEAVTFLNNLQEAIIDAKAELKSACAEVEREMEKDEITGLDIPF